MNGECILFNTTRSEGTKRQAEDENQFEEMGELATTMNLESISTLKPRKRNNGHYVGTQPIFDFSFCKRAVKSKWDIPRYESCCLVG